VAATTGTVLNLSRATYPGQLSTPTINKGNLPINTTDPYKVQILIRRGLGDDNEHAKDFQWICNADQELAVTQLYTNVLQQQIVPSGDKALDMTKPYMPVTYGGRPLNISYKAKQGRLDAVCPETWGIIETVEPSLYDFGRWLTTMPVPVNDGSGTTTYRTSSVFYYHSFLNLFQSNFKAAAVFSGCAVPSVTS